jgi:hypothetical protein
MPWTARDAYRHTKRASTPSAQRQWAHVANSELAKTGDEARAIRAANSVVNSTANKPLRKHIRPKT